MLAYLLNRWIITRRFEKTKDGYIYRRRPDLPGFVVAEQDRKDLLREYRRRYWKFWLFMVACALAGIALVVAVAVVFGLGDKFLNLVSYAFVFALLGFFLWKQRAWSLLPEKRFANYPQIEPELPSAGWLDRFHRMMCIRSWISHIVIILINGTLAWILSFDLSEAGLGQWILLIACTASGMLSLYGAAYKARSMAGS